MPEAAMQIGSFFLDRRALELFRDQRRIVLGAKACKILAALAERCGEVVPTADLIAAGWPGQLVEEVNLRVQIAAIRKVLEAQDGGVAIKTVPREGYLLVIRDTVSPAPDETVEESTLYRPRLLEPLIGRKHEVIELAHLLTTHRIVTITGAAGIGKTSLALAAAAEWAKVGRDWVFVDLASTFVSSQVVQKVHAALELAGAPQDLATDLIRVLRDRTILIVLDNCEQVVDGSAAIVEAIGHETAKVTVLATSREALDLHGEQVFVLNPLDCGPIGQRIAAREALVFPGIELFAQRARAQGQALQIDDGNASLIAEICQRLDGIPLAIQLAAANCGTMTVGELARRLDDRFSLLSRGKRTAIPRHRTLEAALEWGYDLLSPLEAAVFARIGVFRNSASMRDLRDVAGDDDMMGVALEGVVDKLVSKSFLVADTSGDPATFRYLESTRLFALQKLKATNDLDGISRKHALNVGNRLAAIKAMQDPHETLSRYRTIVDDWRAAHDYALENGDGILALELLHQSLEMCSRLNVTHEFGDRAEETFASIAENESPASIRKELAVRHFYNQVLAVYGAERYLVGLNKMTASAKRALELGRKSGAVSAQIEALWSLAHAASGYSDTAAMRGYVEEMGLLAKKLGDRDLIQNFYRLQCAASCWSGQFDASIAVAEKAMTDFNEFLDSLSLRGGGHAAATLTILARAKWAVSEFEEGMTLARKAQRLAPDAPTLYYVYYTSILPLALWSGNIAEAQKEIDAVRNLAREHSAPGWHVQMRQWDVALELLAQSGGSYGNRSVDTSYGPDWRADNATSLHCAFHRSDDLKRMAGRCDHWMAAEHHRAAGERLAQGKQDEREQAEALMVTALRVAESQGAVAWQVRARNSLARLHLANGQDARAAAILAPTLSRFPDNSINADVRLAWTLR
ncbi:winged helix-turn-helix domain-containing protein [Sphingopyxis sp.]|uniref:ATP-binding protein n=1 Tax=Sphingopyxis sp. TaxID=1908224 RepID=UPI002627C5C5|nr:winged helix-turn-helix domain-containing protein [Sphingopyxis sp.]MCW0199850.1 winged helix-turn-helix domain-containing protein [Sphingopyxis sp.]